MITEKTKTIGKNIKYLIEQKGISQRNFAKMCDCTESAVSKYIAGERVPCVKVLSKMSKVLETSMENLLLVDISEGVVEDDKHIRGTVL